MHTFSVTKPIYLYSSNTDENQQTSKINELVQAVTLCLFDSVCFTELINTSLQLFKEKLNTINFMKGGFIAVLLCSPALELASGPYDTHVTPTGCCTNEEETY